MCDIITVHAKECFSHNHLVDFKLFYTENYKEYSQKFPETEFQNAVQSYPFLQQKKFNPLNHSGSYMYYLL
jgi:hypothetical protein